MLISKLARGASAVAILVAVAASALAAPTSVASAATSSHPVALAPLAQGVGMGAHPSSRVRRLQRVLERAGFDVGAPGVDGRFGPLTASAVRRAQGRYGLISDGIVGPKTLRLLKLLAEDNRTVRRGEQPSRQTRTDRRQQPSAQQSPASGRQRPAIHGRTSESTGDQGDTTVPAVVSAFAVILAAAALATALIRRRPATAPSLVAIHHELFLEGHSSEPDVGSFRGLALVSAVPPGADDDAGETRYLVDDPRKPTPVWVNGGDVRRSPSRLATGAPVVGYVATPSDQAREQQDFLRIESVCEQAGWELQEIIREGATGRSPERPGLRRALEQIAAGHARGLVLTETRGVTRSLDELALLLQWFRDADAALVALDLDLNTATHGGDEAAAIVLAVAGWDSDGSSRGPGALAEVQRPGRTSERTEVERLTLIERIAAMRRAGMALQAIADQLSDERVPPLHGREWTPAKVKRALASEPTAGRLSRDLPPLPSEEGR